MFRLAACFALALTLAAQQPAAPPQQPVRDHSLDVTLKAIDDALWHLKLGELAEIEKVSFTSTAPRHIPNPTAQGAGNPMIMRAYVFVPKKLDRSRRHPWLIYVHGGVHSNFNTGSAHIIRELLEEGYPVMAPEYRGSSGYGRGFYEAIDYGGRENDDVFAARNFMAETYEFADPKRCGILGWSHGGMISLMNIFEHPEAYAVAYAGVPVSDLVARMGYKPDSYRRLFSAPYHIGKTAEEDVQEYLRRSPFYHANKLQTPLLVHTNTSDEDVNVLEVRRLIDALQAAGKKFEHKIYENAPGGHSFNRLHTKAARESRREAYAFLAKYLKR
jgi:dipeptidyl aminopeptidase/acylaminoacyl peptidase